MNVLFNDLKNRSEGVPLDIKIIQFEYISS